VPDRGLLAFAALRAALFLFFLISGFCSLVYQVVWLRLAMASFGVNTAIVSTVLSVFMAGLALGSWGAGAWLRRSATNPAAAMRAYAVAELGIGLSAFVVPSALESGGRLLSRIGLGWASAAHFGMTGVWLAFALLPFCVAMGATIPLAMRSVEEGPRAGRSFSYLYTANVAGAAIGTLVSAFVLVELFGFRGTLRLAAGANFAIAASAAILSWRLLSRAPVAGESESPARTSGAVALLAALFANGLVSMAAEVVWVRQYTPYLGTVVYAFAALLAVYLVATFLGSLFYRSLGGRVLARWERWIWFALPIVAVLPLVAADPRLNLGLEGRLFGVLDYDAIVRLLFGVGLFSAATGFVTPLLVDRWSAGRPRPAGFAYAVNVVGCILGPLLAGFVLLPLVGERWALALLALPLLASAWALFRRRLPIGIGAAVVLAVVLGARGFESKLPGAVIRRDATATVVAAGSGLKKRLLVNGIGMTELTPITKMMAHLPLALRESPPRRGTLVVCLGMGTSLRSALAWQAPATAVELVPSVVDVVGYFHADAAGVFAPPRARIVVDDGRRFLARSSDLYDAIVVDPPPPVTAAGSSLLYSREFYAAARDRLAPHGILQQWVPGGSPFVLAAFVGAVRENFRHVRLFGSVEGWGVHILASQEPIPRLGAAELAARLPPAAAADLLEWGPAATAEAQFQLVLDRELEIEKIPRGLVLRDDRPVNEYDFLRRRRERGLARVEQPDEKLAP